VSASAPAILASGRTVMVVADLESTRWLGPVLALGIAVMLLATFTLLPAALALFGNRAFWPRRRPTEATPSRLWVRVGSLVEPRSRLLIAVSLAILVLAALGNLVNTGTIGFGQGESKPTDSSRGTDILDANFPPGVSSPLTVLTASSRADRAASGLQRVKGVQLALPAEQSKDKQRALLAVILKEDPYSPAALQTVERMRTALDRIDPSALVGGITAENLDIESTNSRDTRIVVPAILFVVFLILVVLLRALVAPAYLIVTVVASFAATLGIATLLFTKVLGQEGLSFNLTLLAFMFLVALGVDYNIFLMHRARREASRHGTRPGMIRALVDTGGVVTGAGIVLAGTFATLTILPLEALVQIGGTVALGVLLDTFLVRALLVPAITYRLSDRAWWPSGSRLNR
jgi:putative drug exporter of the RND superfamily